VCEGEWNVSEQIERERRGREERKRGEEERRERRCRHK
jgi:hypothetical protein